MLQTLKGYFQVAKESLNGNTKNDPMQRLVDFESQLHHAYHGDSNKKAEKKHVKEYQEHCLKEFGDKIGLITIDQIMSFYFTCLIQSKSGDDGEILVYGRKKLRGAKAGDENIKQCTLRRYTSSLSKEERSQKSRKLIPWTQTRFVEEERFDRLNTQFTNTEHKVGKVQTNMIEKEIPDDFDKQLVSIVVARPTGDCLNTLSTVTSAVLNSQVLQRPEGQRNSMFTDLLLTKLPSQYLEYNDVFDSENKFNTHCIEIFAKDKGHKKNTAANNLLSKFIIVSRYDSHCLLAFIGLTFIFQFYNGDDTIFNLGDAMDKDMNCLKKFQNIKVIPMDMNSISSNFKSAYKAMGLQHAGRKMNLPRKLAQQKFEALSSIAILQMPQVESTLAHHRDGMLGGGSSSNGEVSRIHYSKNLHVRVLLAAHDWMHSDITFGDAEYLKGELPTDYSVDGALTWLASKQAELKGVKEECKVLMYKEMLISIRFIVEIALRAAPGIMAVSGPSLDPLWKLPIFKSSGFLQWNNKMVAHSNLDSNTLSTIEAPLTESPVLPPSSLSFDSINNDTVGELLKQARSFVQVTKLWASLLRRKEVEGKGLWRHGDKKRKNTFHNRKPLIWYVYCTWSKQIHPRVSNWLTPILVAELCDEKLKLKGWCLTDAVQYIRRNIKDELTKHLPTPSPIGSSRKRYSENAVKEDIMAVLFE